MATDLPGMETSRIVNEANNGTALLGAFTDRIRNTLRANVLKELQPMVDKLVEESVEQAVKELHPAIRARMKCEMDGLTILLMVGDREKKEIKP